MINVGILDADSLYFRICWTTKKQNEIRKYIDRQLKEIEGACLCPDVMKIAVKGRDNFRHEIYKKYKANRPELEPDMKKALNYAHQYLVDKHGAVQADGMEADDLVCIWAHEARELGYAYTICGIDKDLLQIPGIHYNFVKKEYEDVDDDTAYYKLMLQCLTGDGCDGIPGIKGIGPKKAEKLLAGIPRDRMWSKVKATWLEKEAGDPHLSRRLLEMIKTWDEYEDIRIQISGEPDNSEPDEQPLQGKSSEQEQGVRSISERNKRRADGDGVAVREESSESSGTLRGEQQGEGPGQPE